MTRTVNVVDTTAPVVTVLGANPQAVALHGTFTDAGATASDTCAGPLPVTTNGTVNVNAVDTYTIVYVANDGNGNSATNTRTVNVVDTTPVITSKHLVSGNFVINGQGAPNFGYSLLSTTNLKPVISWITNATTVADTNGVFQLEDTNTAGIRQRFYLLSQP